LSDLDSNAGSAVLQLREAEHVQNLPELSTVFHKIRDRQHLSHGLSVRT
jgi:hypothetical protein